MGWDGRRGLEMEMEMEMDEVSRWPQTGLASMWVLRGRAMGWYGRGHGIHLSHSSSVIAGSVGRGRVA